MAAKFTRLTHKIAIQLHLAKTAVPFAVLAPGGQSGSFWIHPRTTTQQTLELDATWNFIHQGWPLQKSLNELEGTRSLLEIWYLLAWQRNSCLHKTHHLTLNQFNAVHSFAPYTSIYVQDYQEVSSLEISRPNECCLVVVFMFLRWFTTFHQLSTLCVWSL